MSNDFEEELPSDKIHKKYISNPSCILDNIRKENIIKDSNFLPITAKEDSKRKIYFWRIIN